MQGFKIMCMEYLYLKFIDSLNFLPMTLSKLSEAFDLPTTKGHFPNLFYAQGNQEYCGELPGIAYYDLAHMKEKQLPEFERWYVAEKARLGATGLVFKDQLIQYCVEDVNILRGACFKFMNEFHALSGINPFLGTISIASACNLVFRKSSGS